MDHRLLDVTTVSIYSNGKMTDLNTLMSQTPQAGISIVQRPSTILGRLSRAERNEATGTPSHGSPDTHPRTLHPRPARHRCHQPARLRLAAAKEVHNLRSMILAAMRGVGCRFGTGRRVQHGRHARPNDGNVDGSGEPGVRHRGRSGQRGGYDGDDDGTTGYGSVPYIYQMGKYDVTVGQYCQFLNAVAKTDTYGLYNSGMATDYPTIGITQSGSSGNYSYSVTGSYSQAANCPIFDVSWGDAARFCNWLQNGQPTGAEGTGTTETGAYTLNGATTQSALMAITRNAGATYVHSVGKRMVQGGLLQGRRHQCRLLDLSDAEQHRPQQRAFRDRHEQRQLL